METSHAGNVSLAVLEYSKEQGVEVTVAGSLEPGDEFER